MDFLLNAICSLSIVLAAVIAAWRFPVIHDSFRPFIYCLWLGTVNEVLSIVLIINGHGNAFNSNIYVLIEAGLLAWQFYQWGLLRRSKMLLPGLLALFALGWN